MGLMKRALLMSAIAGLTALVPARVTAAGTAPGFDSVALELLSAPPPVIDFGVSLGIHSVNPDGWDEFANQQSFGLTFAWRRPTWPLFAALDLHGGGKTNQEYDPLIRDIVYTNSGKHVEAAAGIRWIGYPRMMIVSVGGGLAYVHGTYGKDTVRVDAAGNLPKDTAGAFGPWVSAEARLRFTEWYSAGVGVRAARAHGTLYDRRVDLGGTEIAVTLLGVTWPNQPMPDR